MTYQFTLTFHRFPGGDANASSCSVCQAGWTGAERHFNVAKGVARVELRRIVGQGPAATARRDGNDYAATDRPLGFHRL